MPSLPLEIDLKCPLCLETCCVPVELTCFPCFSLTSVHCYSFTRLCFQCAVSWLQLHLVPSQRPSSSLKCLYCEERVVPSQIEAKTGFRIDFFLSARHGGESDETGPDVEWRCGACPETFPTRRGLEDHVLSRCEHTYRHLCPCGTYYASVATDHPCTRCVQCNEFIAVTKKARHDEEQHPGHFCHQCHQFVQSRPHHHQSTECIARHVVCDFCGLSFEAIHFVDHLLSHLEESNERSRCLADVLNKEQQLRQCILRKCCTSYSELYGQEDTDIERFSMP